MRIDFIKNFIKNSTCKELNCEGGSFISNWKCRKVSFLNYDLALPL